MASGAMFDPHPADNLAGRDGVSPSPIKIESVMGYSHPGLAGILPHPGPLPLGEGVTCPAFRHGYSQIQQ
jgi:hypothetical protein